MIALFVAAQLAAVAYAPDTATSCAPFQITVAARASGRTAPRIIAPAGSTIFQLLRSVTTSRVEDDGAGRTSAITEGTYTVALDGNGRTAIPAFAAVVDGRRVAAVPNGVALHEAIERTPVVLVRASLDHGAADGDGDSVVVGQQLDYVVDVQLNDAARQRLRRNPTFFPPEMPGVLAYDLAPPASVARVGRRCFETLSYRRALFPLFAGVTTISPASLTYSLPLSTSFFSREESFELRTDSVRFIAHDVPAAGRPPDFAGAVGTVSASSRLSTQQARMGDPVVYTLRLEGVGNVKLWPRPPFIVPWATVAQGEERVEVDTSTAQVRGAKEFDWLLTPRVAGHQALEALPYPFFDPVRRAYDITRTGTLSLDVAAASLASTDSTSAPRLPIRRTLGAERRAPVSGEPWYWLALIAAPIPAAVRRVVQRRSRRKSGVSPRTRLSRAAARHDRLAPRDVRRLYLDAIAERVPATSGAPRKERFVRALRHAGVTGATADTAAAMLEQLDAAAFSPAGPLGRDVLEQAAAVVQAIHAESVRDVGAAIMPSLLLALLIASGVAITAQPAPIANVFDRGVQAYDHGAYRLARDDFARVATRAPRAPDAWANLGTAAWATGDTANAVRGWQRALRLDPLDDDTRDRLDAVQGTSLRARGYVVPAPPDAFAFAALGCWLVAWLALALPPSRRPAQTRALAGGVIVGAVLLLGATMETRTRLDPRGLGVLRTSRMLMEAPASSNAAASGVIGETGRLDAREGAWVHLTLDASRSGWLPLAAVLPLDAPALED